MFNETIGYANNLTQNITKLSYEQVSEINQSPLMLIAIGVIWLIPIIIYLIVAGCVRAKTSSGVKLKRPMLYSANAWIPFLIWFFIQALLILVFLIFPFWLGLAG